MRENGRRSSRRQRHSWAPGDSHRVKVFLTGGSGLIGSHLAERLVRSGHEVVALQRTGSDTEFLERLGCSIVRGDILDSSDAHARRIEGCDQIVHAAALIYASASWPVVKAANVDGTRNVLLGAEAAGVPHAVHVSSVAVYGHSRGTTGEDAPIDTPLRAADLYARSKREAELAAIQVHERGNLAVTVVRPAAVYGERDRLFAPKVASVVRLPLVPLLGSGRTTLPVVYAGNVASGIERAFGGAGEGRAFNLSDDFPVTQRELFRGLARGMGTSVRFVSIPRALLRTGARLADRFGAGIPGAADLALQRVVELAVGGNPYPSARAREVLHWDPEVEHSEGLRRTGEWLTAKTR